MNEDYIIEKVIDSLNSKDELSFVTFHKIFGHFEEYDLEEIESVLRKNGITIVDREPKTDSASVTPRVKCDRYSNLTNEQLCVLYKGGEKGILDVLCKKNQGFIYRVAKKHQTKTDIGCHCPTCYNMHILVS